MYRLVCLLSALAPFVLWESSAWAAPSGHDRITIEIDVTQLGDSRPDLDTDVLERLEAQIDARGELPRGAVRARDRKVVVELSPGPIPDSDDIIVRVSAVHDAEVVGQSDTEMCLACGSQDVVQLVSRLLWPVLEQLPPPPAPVEEDRSEAAGEPLPEEPRAAKRHRPLLISGGILLGVGAVGLGIGLTLVAIPAAIPERAPYVVVNYRPPAIGITVGAAALVISGAVVLGLGVERWRANQLSLAPMVGSKVNGVVVSGRF